MEAAALDRILQLARSGMELNDVTDIPATVLPKDCKVESLEHLLATPHRMRRVFTTQRLTDFLAYVAKEQRINSTAVFVTNDGASAEAMIDYGTHDKPEWAGHRAELAMQYTPEYAALAAVCGKDLSQRDLLDWIEDWNHILYPQIDDKEVTVAQAVAAISSVRIDKNGSRTHEEKNFGAARTAMEEIEARSKEGNLPNRFGVSCSVYPDTENRTITARLSLLTGDEKPRFRLRIMGLDAIKKDIAEEVQASIRAGLASGVRVFVGAIK